MTQIITRLGAFDAGHRVINHKSKCKYYHGHRYSLEISFDFDEVDEIGFAIDFGDIKRIGLGWIDHRFDHRFIANPADKEIIKLSIEKDSLLHIMSLNGTDVFCNPTAENIAKEIFIMLDYLFEDYEEKGLSLHQIRLYETPNNFIDTFKDSLETGEVANVLAIRKEEMDFWKTNILK